MTVTAAELATYLGLPPGSDQAVLDQAAGSANAYVTRLPWLELDLEAGAADVHDGCVKLAARLYRRRNTPSGIEAFGDAGAAYVARADPEIRMLLRLATPRVG